VNHSDAEILIVDSEWGSLVENIAPSLPKIRHVIQVNSGYASPLQVIDYEQLLAASAQDEPCLCSAIV
jgi:fatty-acyl-CoA synthase